jgi:hypothetical protein
VPDTDLDLSDLVDLERFTGLSSAEIEAAKTDFHMSICREPIWQCPDCASKLKAHRLVIAAVSSILREDERSELSAAGRLLPEGATREVAFRIRWNDGGPGFRAEWDCGSLERARELVRDECPDWATSWEISAQEQWTGQWVPVEPAAVKEASE